MKIDVQNGVEELIWWSYVNHIDQVPRDDDEEAYRLGEQFRIKDIPTDELPAFLVRYRFVLIQPEGDYRSFLVVYNGPIDRTYWNDMVEKMKRELCLSITNPDELITFCCSVIGGVINSSEHIREAERELLFENAIGVLLETEPNIWHIKFCRNDYDQLSCEIQVLEPEPALLDAA